MVTGAQQVSMELARRILEGGNLGDLEYALKLDHYEVSGIDLVKAQDRALSSREALNRVLGLWGPLTQWKLADALPELPEQEPALEHLESIAVQNRLDLAQARVEINYLALALGATVQWRYLPVLETGIDAERGMASGA